MVLFFKCISLLCPLTSTASGLILALLPPRTALICPQSRWKFKCLCKCVWVWSQTAVRVCRLRQRVPRLKTQTRCRCWRRSPGWRLRFLWARALCCSRWPRGSLGGEGRRAAGGGDDGVPGGSRRESFQRAGGKDPAAACMDGKTREEEWEVLFLWVWVSELIFRQVQPLHLISLLNLTKQDFSLFLSHNMYKMWNFWDTCSLLRQLCLFAGGSWTSSRLG